MPVLDFQNEEGTVLSVHVSLEASKEAFHTQVEGRMGRLRQRLAPHLGWWPWLQRITGRAVYKRIYSAPLAAKDVRRGDATREDFQRLTTDKKGLTVGQMQDLAKEMAHERKEKRGVDAVSEKWYADYERKMGEPHKDIKQRRAREALAKRGVHLK